MTSWPSEGGAIAAPADSGWFGGAAPAIAYDVAVIGAGPAGLAAATAAADGGARVALLDAGPRAGGQYWRHRPADDGARQHDWTAFLGLRAAVERHAASGSLAVRQGHAVWHLERTPQGWGVHALAGRRAATLAARIVVVATGAYDRQLPFPGWTLPGVFTAGGVQALLKGHGVVAGRRIVVGGTGPFLLPVAAGLADAGATVAAVLEAGRPTSFARHPRTTIASGRKLLEGAAYLRTLRRHRVPYRTRAAVIAALGDGAVTGARIASLDRGWRPIAGTERDVECDTIAVGYGFTPQTELALQLGCAMRLDEDGSLVAVVDEAQRATVPSVFVAGEATGVGGGRLALVEGEIAGIHAAAEAAGVSSDPRRLARLRRSRARERAFASAMHEAFAVRDGWQQWLADDTVVCRCEEVGVAAVRDAVERLGASDPRTVKLLARTGMGMCQGRVCGWPTAQLVATACGRRPTAADLAGIAARPVAQPVPLGEIAVLDEEGR